MISFLTCFEICCISCLNIPLTEAKRQISKLGTKITNRLIWPKSKLEWDLLSFLSVNVLHKNSHVICYTSRYCLRRCKNNVFCYTCMGPGTFRNPSNYCQMHKRVIHIYTHTQVTHTKHSNQADVIHIDSQSVCDKYLKANLLSVKEKLGNDIYFW